MFALGLIRQLALPAPGSAPAPLRREHVLVLLNGDITRPINLSVLQGIREELNKSGGESVEIHTESFVQSPGYESQMRAMCQAKYANTQIRAIVTVNALVSGVDALRSEFWPGVPLLYLSSGTTPTAVAANSAMVVRELDVEGTLAVAHQLFPDAKRLVVVGGASQGDRARSQGLIQISKKDFPGWQIVDMSGLTATQMRDTIAATPPDSVIMLTGLNVDGAMQQVTSPQLVNLFLPVARAPMFDLIDSAFSSGIVGGALAQNREAGNEIGKLLLRVLGGEPPSNIAPIRIHSKVLLDWRQLRRFGIPESRIPEGAEVRFRNPSPWQAYRRWIVGGLLAVLAQGLLILFLLAERRSRRASETALSERLRYEQIVAEISASFARVPPGGRAEQLDNSLRRLTEFLGAERTSLWRYSSDSGEFESVHSWRTEAGAALPTLSPIRAPEMAAQLKAGKTVRIEQVALLPETNETRRVLTQRGARSAFGIPLETGGRLVGALIAATFSYERVWPDSLMKGLQTLGELFANELALRGSEEATRAGEELNSAVLASLPGNRAIIDRNGTIVKVNDAWANSSAGIGTLCAPVGQNYVDFCTLKATSVPVLNEISEAVKVVLARQASQTAIEINVAANETQQWLEIRVQALVGEQGGAVISQLDVTSRKRSEIQSAQNLEFISHLNRVGALNELASSLAHELNQPLAAIGANAESAMMMVDNLSEPAADLKEAVSDIISDNLRAGEVIGHMRDLLKKRERFSVITDLNEAAAKVLPLVRNEASLRKIELRMELEPDLPAVMSDPVQLQQVILNLVVNGMDAMTNVPEACRVLTMRSHASGDRVELEVEDCGGGIPAEALKTIFESFYTTKPNGLGIGLSICRSIVEAEGGSIWAENGKLGAVFRFVLPATSAGSTQFPMTMARSSGQ